MAEPAAEQPTRRGYAVTVMLGLAGAGLAAVAGARAWATTRGDAAGIRVDASVTGAEAQPVVSALALVALASWGVLLVTRGRVRRIVAVVGLLASAGSLAGVGLGFTVAQDAALQAAVDQGASGDTFVTSLGPWYYLAGVGALVAAAAFAVAVRSAPRWPAMGSRYDAPAARRTPEDTPRTPEDMWRAMDDGRDPTS